MSCTAGPKTVNDGLVFHYDMANTDKSWKGAPMTNSANNVVFTQPYGNDLSGNSFVSTGYASYAYTETNIIPELGETTVYRMNIQNNYTTYTPNSSYGFPILYKWSGSGFSISPSTLYTYGIVYKSDSGYTSSEYMYRYEIQYEGDQGFPQYTGGIFDTGKRTYLGDGWYYAWNTFTTTSSTAWISNAGLHYNRYSQTSDNLYIAKVLIAEGDWSDLHPKVWPESLTTRSNTESIIDIAGGQPITPVGLTYNSDNTFELNSGVRAIDTSRVPNTGTSTQSLTWECWCYPTTAAGDIINMTSGVGWNMCPIWSNASTFYAKIWSNATLQSLTTFTTNQWYHLVLVFNYSVTVGERTGTFYVNGVQQGTQSSITYSASGYENYHGFGRAGSQATNTYFTGKIPYGKIYNKALTSAEVKENFEATRSRYGI